MNNKNKLLRIASILMIVCAAAAILIAAVNTGLSLSSVANMSAEEQAAVEAQLSEGGLTMDQFPPEQLGIGFDVIGLDPIADVNLTRHKKLFLKNDIINLENLYNLEQYGKDLFWFSCFPLKTDHSDGSPVRAVAWFE